MDRYAHVASRTPRPRRDFMGERLILLPETLQFGNTNGLVIRRLRLGIDSEGCEEFVDAFESRARQGEPKEQVRINMNRYEGSMPPLEYRFFRQKVAGCIRSEPPNRYPRRVKRVWRRSPIILLSVSIQYMLPKATPIAGPA